MAFDAEERLWMGEDSALLSLSARASEVERWSLALDISMFHVNALLVDAEGSLWIGSDTGLLQVRMAPPFSALSPGAGDDRNSFVFSVAQAPNGDFWTSTLPGVTRWSGGKPQFYAQPQGLLRPDIRSIAVNADGTVWVAGMTSSVYRLDNDQFVRVTDAKGNSLGARSLLARRDGGVWVGPHDGGLGLVKQDRFEWMFHPSAPGRDRIVDMKEAKDGTLWLATQRDGLMAWREGRKIILDETAGIPRVELFFLHLTSEDHLWIGTDGAGLFYFDGRQARQVSSKQGLAHDRVFSILPDDLGNFWLGSPRGVFVIRGESLTAVVEGKKGNLSCLEFGPEDGVAGEPVHPFPPSAIRAADGTLVFATTFGALKADPKKLRGTSAPRVFVNSITLGGTRVDPNSEVIATAEPATDVSLELSAPAFKAPHRVRFRHRLHGTNAGWTETQGRRLLFERLPRGRHQIVVQAYHVGTDVGPPSEASVSLLLLAPWHQRLAVRLSLLVLLALVIAAAILAAMRFRRRRIEEAQAAIVAERNRIAQEIHDGLEQGLCGLRLQIESAVAALPESTEMVRASLERANALVADASVDLRTAIWQLQRDATDTVQLLNALEQRLRRATAGTAVALHADAKGPSRTLPVTVASHLVAITREAVANALKHASATEIALRLDSSDPGELVLEITDNGKGGATVGAPPQPGSAGLGISGMRARARAMNGVFQLLTRNEGGTLIRVRIPLQRSGR